MDQNPDDVSSFEAKECTFQGCKQEVLNKCRACGLDYCLDHASEVDPGRYCVNCLLPADASFNEAPLVDAEGVAHAGRVIHPTGKGYRLSAKMISEMTEDELKTFVNEEKARVADIERIREYHHITLGLAESELYQRHLGTFSEKGGILHLGVGLHESARSMPRQSHARTPSAKSKVSKVDKLATMLTDLGLTAKDLAALISTKKGK